MIWGDVVYFSGHGDAFGTRVLHSLESAQATVDAATAYRLAVEATVRSSAPRLFYTLAHEIGHCQIVSAGPIMGVSLDGLLVDLLAGTELGEWSILGPVRPALLSLLRSATLAEVAAKAALRWLLGQMARSAESVTPKTAAGAPALAQLSATLAREWEAIDELTLISPSTPCPSVADVQEETRTLGLRIPVFPTLQHHPCAGRPAAPAARGTRLARAAPHRPLGRDGHLRAYRPRDLAP
jgi:hypothetical protein